MSAKLAKAAKTTKQAKTTKSSTANKNSRTLKIASTNKSKKQYIESHWLVFAIKGALAAIVGLCLNLSFGDADSITLLLGFFMLALAITELLNVYHREKKQRAWGIPLAVSIIEFFVAMTMLLAAVPEFILGLFPGNDYSEIQGGVLMFRVAVLGFYTLYAAVTSIIFSFSSFTNKTDRFIWLMEGMFGAVLAFAILAENGLDATTHLRVFGAYLLVKGLTDLIFGVHSKEQLDAVKAKRGR